MALLPWCLLFCSISRYASRSGVSKLWSTGHTGPAAWFLYRSTSKEWFFTLLNGRKSRRILLILWHMKIKWITVQCSWTQADWRTATPLGSVLSVAALVLCQQSWGVATETVWPAEGKIFTVWPLTEKVCRPLLQLAKKKKCVKWSITVFTFRC